MEEDTARKLETIERQRLEQQQLTAERAKMQEQMDAIRARTQARESELQELLAAEGERVKALEATVQDNIGELHSARSAWDSERILLQQELENQRREQEAERALVATQVLSQEYACGLEAQVQALQAQIEELRVSSERDRQEQLEAARQNAEVSLRQGTCVCLRVLACACPWRRKKIDAVLCHAAAVAQETAECYIILCLLHPDIYHCSYIIICLLPTEDRARAPVTHRRQGAGAVAGGTGCVCRAGAPA